MAATIALAVLRVVLHLPESGSLKSKRMVVSSLMRRIRNEFQVAAAEVGELDRWQLAELAFVAAGRDARHCEEVVHKVLRFIEGEPGDALVAGVSTETVRL